jgi:hypothetical protein
VVVGGKVVGAAVVVVAALVVVVFDSDVDVVVVAIRAAASVVCVEPVPLFLLPLAIKAITKMTTTPIATQNPHCFASGFFDGGCMGAGGAVPGGGGVTSLILSLP